MTRNAPIIRKRIQGHINVVVRIQILLTVRDRIADLMRIDLNLVLGHAQLGKHAADCFLVERTIVPHDVPEKELGMRRFCFLAFGLAVMTISKLAKQKDFSSKDEAKLSRNTVMTFYVFTQFAVRSDLLMQIFFNASSKSLRKEI